MASERQRAANRLNRAKRRGLTAEGRERLRQAALLHKPWRFATGPVTAAGKARSRLNARKTGEHDAAARARRARAAAIAQLQRELPAVAPELARLLGHGLPEELDSGTATAWIRKLRELQSAAKERRLEIFRQLTPFPSTQ